MTIERVFGILKTLNSFWDFGPKAVYYSNNMQSQPRLYADVNRTMDKSYYDYENYEFDVG